MGRPGGISGLPGNPLEQIPHVERAWPCRLCLPAAETAVMRKCTVIWPYVPAFPSPDGMIQNFMAG